MFWKKCSNKVKNAQIKKNEKVEQRLFSGLSDQSIQKLIKKIRKEYLLRHHEIWWNGGNYLKTKILNLSILSFAFFLTKKELKKCSQIEYFMKKI